MERWKIVLIKSILLIGILQLNSVAFSQSSEESGDKNAMITELGLHYIVNVKTNRNKYGDITLNLGWNRKYMKGKNFRDLCLERTIFSQ